MTETTQAIRDWAAAEAAKLKPLSDEDCRAIGRIARQLDKQRAEKKMEEEQRGLPGVG